ncbi:glycosyltransferase [Lutispora sp.]|uniref:glycosyltransferase n=1 Tax=Lutispora sp. TaxID=2828727 RepID=UPI003561E691
MNISIIIPIKAKPGDKIINFANYILCLSNELKNYECEIIIADESEDEVSSVLSKMFKKACNIKHFIPETSVRIGANDKLNGVYAALNYCKYDKVLLLDDHYRLTISTLEKVNNYYDVFDCFKMMPKFHNTPLSVLVDLCGMFVINVLDYRKQYCGHLAFRKSQYDKVGFPSRDALFDEFAMEKHLRINGYNIGFVKDVSLEAIQDITFIKFLEQRVRYAYENLAIPSRFFLYAIVIPITILLGLININYSVMFAAAITSFIILIAFIGQILYGMSIAPFYTFLFSPVWFWFYPFTTWISIYKYFKGGVMFGGRKIKRAS